MGPAYYNCVSPILNWWKTAQEPDITRLVGGPLSGKAVWDAGGYLDPDTGEIIANSGVATLLRNFFSPVDSSQVTVGANFALEPFIVEFDGAATVSMPIGGTVTQITPNKFRLTLPDPAGNTRVMFTLTDQNNPPVNIRLYQERYQTNWDNGERFNPDWLPTIQDFGVLRLMDWAQTNNNDIVEFDQLADENYHVWHQPFGDGNQHAATGYGPKGSMHPFIFCELAAIVGKPIHVCLPVRCSDAFITEFATYMRDNCSVEVLYEFSNECWHFGFTQAGYCLSEGSTNWPGNAARYKYWHGYRTAQMLAIVAGVYGVSGQGNGRWRGVLNTQGVNTSVAADQLIGAAYWKTETGFSGNINERIHDIHHAPYFGDTIASKAFDGASRTNPVRIYSRGHGYVNGQKLRTFTRISLPEVHNGNGVVANATPAYYDLTGVDNSAGTYLANTTLSSGISAGATTIPLTSTSGISSGNAVGILQDNGEVFWGTVNGAPAGGNITLSVSSSWTSTATITNASPAVIGCSNHNLVVGDPVRPSTTDTLPAGITAGNIYYVIASNFTTGQYSISATPGGAAINTSSAGSGTHSFSKVINAAASGKQVLVYDVTGSNNFATKGELYDLMDESESLNGSAPLTYPTIYTYYNQQVAQSILTGTCSEGFTTSLSVAQYLNVYIPAQVAYCASVGMGCRQYEGGCGMSGDVYLTGFGGEPQVTGYVIQFGHTEEAGDLYDAYYRGCLALGVSYPSKFVAEGSPSRYGTWGGYRFYPTVSNGGTTDDNPVMVAVRKYNSEAVPETFTVNW
jgi:hypothetical protein